MFINQTMPPQHTGTPSPSPLGISLLRKDCKSQRCWKAAHKKLLDIIILLCETNNNAVLLCCTVLRIYWQRKSLRHTTSKPLNQPAACWCSFRVNNMFSTNHSWGKLSNLTDVHTVPWGSSKLILKKKNQ